MLAELYFKGIKNKLAFAAYFILHFSAIKGIKYQDVHSNK